MIVIVFGLPGSGKSYFASRLARELQADYINTDRIRKEMFTKRKYTDNEKRAVYHKMLNYAHDSVRTNRSIVLDGTFHKKEFREKFQDKWQPKDLTFIEVTAEEPLAFTRLQKPREYSEADIEVYKKLRKEWEPFKEEHLILRSTDDNIENMLSQAKAYLRFNNDKRGNK